METSIIDLDDIGDRDCIWNVTDSSAPSIPAYFPPMNKKSIILVKDTSPSHVADRISNFLRKMSIVAEYNNELANARVITSNQVHLLISLYRSRNSFSSGTIVECIRLRGCARTFHIIRRQVLNSAFADDSIDIRESSGRIHALDRFPYSKSGSSNAFDPPDNEVSNAVLGLEIALRLLKKDRLDANILGMESMINLTDENVCTGYKTVSISARAVLGVPETTNEEVNLGEIREDRFIEIHNLVISLLRDRKLSTSNVSDHVEGHFAHETSDDEDDIIADHEDLEHVSLMRSLAMRVFLNSLKVAEQSSFLESALNATKKENILPALVEEVRKTFLSQTNANQALNAYDAVVSVEILRILNIYSSDARKCCLGLGLVDVLNKAFSVGRRRHAKLEEETKKTLSVLRDL